MGVELEVVIGNAVQGLVFRFNKEKRRLDNQMRHWWTEHKMGKGRLSQWKDREVKGKTKGMSKHSERLTQRLRELRI